MKKGKELTNGERIAAINKLIPSAAKEADKKLRAHKLTGGADAEERAGAKGSTYRHVFWNQFYHQAMNRLAKERGLR